MGQYSTSDEERWLKDRLADNLLVLDDDSTWEVSQLVEHSVKVWVRFSRLKVSSAERTEYPYMLVNTSYNQAVPAKFLGSYPEMRGIHIHDLSIDTDVSKGAPPTNSVGVYANEKSRDALLEDIQQLVGKRVITDAKPSRTPLIGRMRRRGGN